MRSKGFVCGFNKTAGVGSKIVNALGGKFNIATTGIGAVLEGASGMKKMTDAAAGKLRAT